VVEPDRRKAIFAAMKTARPGDAVIIAGKGARGLSDRRQRPSITSTTREEGACQRYRKWRNSVEKRFKVKAMGSGD